MDINIRDAEVLKIDYAAPASLAQLALRDRATDRTVFVQCHNVLHLTSSRGSGKLELPITADITTTHYADERGLGALRRAGYDFDPFLYPPAVHHLHIEGEKLVLDIFTESQFIVMS